MNYVTADSTFYRLTNIVKDGPSSAQTVTINKGTLKLDLNFSKKGLTENVPTIYADYQNGKVNTNYTQISMKDTPDITWDGHKVGFNLQYDTFN